PDLIVGHLLPYHFVVVAVAAAAAAAAAAVAAAAQSRIASSICFDCSKQQWTGEMSQRESVWVTGGQATVESLDVPKGRWRGALSGALDCFDCLDRPDCLCRCRGYLHSGEDERLGRAPAGRCSEAKCLRGIGE